MHQSLFFNNNNKSGHRPSLTAEVLDIPVEYYVPWNGDSSSKLIILEDLYIISQWHHFKKKSVYSLWPVDRQPIDKPPTQDQVVGREV